MRTTTLRLGSRALAGATAALLLVGVASTVSAHSQTVQPPSQDAPTVTGPISKPWAQAHCQAQAPEAVAGTSSGVVTFTPPGNIPCPPVPNPGGQVHGD